MELIELAALSRHLRKLGNSDIERHPFNYSVVHWILHAEGAANANCQSESDRELAQKLWDAVSRFLTDDSVRRLWVSSFPSYSDVHKGRCLRCSGGSSFSALCIASSYGLCDVLQQILSSGIDPIDPERGVNCVDGDGRSPLSWAASRGYMGAALALLDCGADIETRDSEYGQTPLSWAAENGCDGVVQLLLDRGADIETRSNGGCTPLSFAARNGCDGVVQLLLERGADIETRINNGVTPLSWAARYGRDGVVQLLLERGADIETRDSYGQTPLSCAAEKGHDGVVQLLLERGADIETRDNSGLTPLSWAAKNRHDAVVQLLNGEHSN